MFNRLVVFAGCLAASSGDFPFRSPHPLAPSLPQLSDAEEDELDALIDRFMLFDIGKLPGPAGLKAQKDFDALGPEAVPALLRGFARSARLDHDCPVTVIAKKLRLALLATTNRKYKSLGASEISRQFRKLRLF